MATAVMRPAVTRLDSETSSGPGFSPSSPPGASPSAAASTSIPERSRPDPLLFLSRRSCRKCTR